MVIQEEKENSRLSFDEFQRAIQISKNDTFSLLLGAGCSITSDIPSAEDCIWEWKRDIYKTNNQSALGWVENYKNSNTQNIIQNWLNNQGVYPEKGSKEEYSFYAKRCYPIDEHRRQYFQKICSGKKPSIGYKTIPILAKQGMLDSVWTTNLDELVMTACAGSGIQAIEITLDSVQRINQRSQNRTELPVIKLHGDFKYGDLKNTEEELLNQDNTFRRKLIDYLQDKHFIVVGYSGRDASLMEALKEAYSKPGGGMLYWCGYGDCINSDVEELLLFAKNNGRNAFYISTDGFDSALRKIVQVAVEENTILKAELIELHKTTESKETATPFNLNPERINKILKSNIFKIDFPNEVFVFNAQLGGESWRYVDEKVLENPNVTAIPYNGQIWTFGRLDVIKATFKDIINGDVSRKPLGNIKIYNSSISRLLLSTICKILAQQNGLKTDFKRRIWSENEFQTIDSQKVFNAIKLSFDKISGGCYLSLNPDFILANADVDEAIIQNVGLKFFHKMWNNKFNDYVNHWRDIFFKTNNEYEFPYNSGTGFKFRVTKAPIFTNVCDLNNQYQNSHNVRNNLLNFKGIQFKEVPLLFSTNNGNRTATDTHPMRGLLLNKPYETGINIFLPNTVELSIISPEQDTSILFQFLENQNQQIKKYNQNDNYIIDFEGFFKTYGISLNIPTPKDDEWITLKEIVSKDDVKKGALEVRQMICDSITKISSTTNRKIVVIYIPRRWEDYTSYTIEGESFDLHDYIKAFCAEKGIMSQLIREKTLHDLSQKCQIHWWLSLSFFVKSLRIPWILANTDKTIAFAGLGYSVDNKIDAKGHIVLGCSHIYSSSGEGLKFKLSRISNDKIHWRHKKPHLCYDDAYEFGKNIVGLFYESMNELPKRIVIHKRTFFTEEEKQGIINSLSDSNKIESIDLIEINFEDNIKYTSSKIINGEAKIDGYSVSRGTCIQLNEKEALLWAHGIIPSVRNPQYSFYPGGRYIPKPLRIIKHYGTGSLEQIANEILGLTKMNWNSLNMYSQLPVTICSSNDIARIGKLIDSSSKNEYDYRYFI
ncbi:MULTISPECIES: SIR2 family protein [unclassified Dysgonomonas]|uniref:SIR2 family protein n=1 Tax=unclassified Dysgonomonas TaxID=2630389 RepID=UPI0025B96A86|nr:MULTISPECIES: SIR2 family protein [unclassified Dysgonomonas]